MKRVILLTLVLSLSVSLIACSTTDSTLQSPYNKDSVVDNSSSMYGIKEELLGCWSTEPEYELEYGLGYNCNLEAFSFFGNGTYCHLEVRDKYLYRYNFTFGSWFAEDDGTLVMYTDDMSSARLRKYSIVDDALTIKSISAKPQLLFASNENIYDLCQRTLDHLEELDSSINWDEYYSY